MTRSVNLQASNCQPRSIKLLFVGSSGSGKTTALNTLSQGKCISTEVHPSDSVQLYKRYTTVAMDYAKVQFSRRLQLHLYGSPGQRRFAFMHTILRKNAQGLIIMVNNAQGDPFKEVAYYLDQHYDFLQHHQAVIGVTHNDQRPQPSLRQYRHFLNDLGYAWPILKVDARQTVDMLELLSVLLEQVSPLTLRYFAPCSSAVSRPVTA